MTIASFTLQSATTQGAAPFSIGHAFKKGDVPAGSQLVGSITDLQVVAKNAWPDGSLKFAVVSGRASLSANTPLTVSLSIGTQSAGTALTAANLKATGITASIGAGAFGSVSWSGTDFDAPWQSWVSGPSMSSWVYRKPIGTDLHLVAFIEVRLFAGGEVEVLPWVENGYLNVAGPTSKQDTFTFTLGGTQRFSSILNFLHHTRSPLVSGAALSYWLATDPGVTPRHDVAYMQTTELVPSYSMTTTTSAVGLSASATYTPFQAGGFIYTDQGYGADNMANSGYQRPIGLLPTHDVAYLVCTDSPDLLYSVVVRNGFSAGRYPIHYRDETTNRPLRISQYPLLALGNGSGVNQSGSTNGAYTPDATGGYRTWDAAHHPSVGFMAYLVTGRWYFFEETQFATTINYLARNQVARGSAQNLLKPDLGGWQTRTTAWNWRTLTQALAITPDSDTNLRNEFITSVQNNIDYYYNIYVAQPNNPYGMVEPSEYYDSGTEKYQSPWQQDFLTGSWGYSVSMGLPLSSAYQTRLAQFFQWKARSVIFRLGTSAGFWYINADAYVMRISSVNMPDYVGGTGPWLATDADVYAATYDPSVSTEVSTSFAWRGSTEGTLCGENMPGANSYWGNLHPAIAYAVRHGAPGAQAAYARLTGASNYSALASQFNTVPVWGIKPLSVGVAVTHAIGPSIRFGRLRSGRITISKYRGNGIPASAISSTGANGPALLYNDVDSVNDPVGTLYRLEMPVPTTSTGTTLPITLNEDSSFYVPAGTPDGTFTSTQNVYKNGTLAYTEAFSASIGAASPTVTMVTVSPLAPSVAGGGTQQFSASVVGTNSPAQTVTWSVTGGGSINSSGLFTAPAATSSAQTITVRATSTVDATKNGTATVTVAAVAPAPTVTSVSVSPATASLSGGASQTFTATVTGANSPAQGVTWTPSLGTINSSGVFTAPAATSSAQIVTITARSTVDTTKTGTATVTVAAASATVSSVSISPSTASVGGGAQQQFIAAVTGTNGPAQSITWSANGGSISTGGLFTAPVATGSIQTIVITATSTADGSKSATATVTIGAATPTVSGVTVSPASATVRGGNQAQFSASVSGYFGPSQAVAWSASAGTITSGGLWTAPPTGFTAQQVTITATSTFDGTKSGVASITVPAFDVPTAPLGVAATAGMGTVSVVVTPPGSNGGTAITGYQVTASSGQVITSAGNTMTFTLPAFAPVSFTAVAVNAIGPGQASSPSNTVIPRPVESTVPADYSTAPAPRERTLRM